MTVVAIHQPNFFPWLGYFDKIAQSDIFIFLDHVQFPKKGGSWSNRVKLRLGGDARWLTAPVDRSHHGVKRISDMEFKSGDDWKNKIIKNLETNYADAPFFYRVIDFLEPLILNPENIVSSYNCSAVLAIARYLGLNVENIFLSSDLAVSEKATEMLVSLVKSVSGDAYLCGGGAGGYQEDHLFQKSGINLIYQAFNSPIYEQCSNTRFLPGLSIIDAMMHSEIETIHGWFLNRKKSGAMQGE